MEKLIVSQKLSVQRGTGDVWLKESDASEITILTDTGDVTGSLLSEKVFFAVTDTGRVTVPKTITGGMCEIRTNTGDIRIEITCQKSEGAWTAPSLDSLFCKSFSDKTDSCFDQTVKDIADDEA